LVFLLLFCLPKGGRFIGITLTKKVLTNFSLPNGRFFYGENMAVATAERLKSPVNIEPLLNGIGGLIKLDRNKVSKVSPWETIWETRIPHEVIFTTTAFCLKHQTALLFPVSPEQNEGVNHWRNQTKRDLIDHFNQTPRSKEVCRRLRKAHMIIPFDLTEIDMRETLGERCQRFLDNVTIGRNRLLKVIK